MPQLFRILACCAALALAAPAAHAGLCEDGLTTGSAPLLTPVIDSVLRGDYRELTEALDPAAVMLTGDRQAMIAELEARAPLGYDDCAVLVARPLSTEFEVYLMMFGADKGRLYAFLAASRIDGQWTFVHQRFSPDFAEVYELLR
ncbi:hypothetical protein [Paragemmobacter straminiformis]|uniref:Uncharacterized protein n=1 Tax=Paragemmobacter straminiformis TaxID=2045119 RepID=A0A842IAW1_9RHOB|nr:hypothetical protein [Gemmobacter straminiformis]MBC2836128.1 hypothetical protein [Gemmobacter straminiformis]